MALIFINNFCLNKTTIFFTHFSGYLKNVQSLTTSPGLIILHTALNNSNNNKYNINIVKLYKNEILYRNFAIYEYLHKNIVIRELGKSVYFYTHIKNYLYSFYNISL